MDEEDAVEYGDIILSHKGSGAMQKLTDEQVERAREAVATLQRDRNRFGNESVVIVDALRVAAPYLQMPWDEPTDQEVRTLFSVLNKTVPYDEGLRSALRAFVDNRNALILPKPVDPRRERLVKAFIEASGAKYIGQREDAERRADIALAALDEVK